MRRGSALVVLLLALALVAAACGDSASESTAPAPVETTAATQPPVTQPPATQAPVTQPPATAAPTTEPATTTTATSAVTTTSIVESSIPVIETRDVTFPTADGLTLEGTAFGNGPEYVVLAHMLPADKTHWFGFAKDAAAAGFTALAFNFRGYGDSDGPREPFDVETDVLAAIDFALAEGATAVYVMGASMGGSGTLAAAPQRDLAGVASLSAPDNFSGADAIGAVPEIDEPKLFVAAENDQPYADIVDDFFAVATDPRARQIYDGSAHGTDLFGTHGDELTALLLDFLTAP
jgi:alpha/beta superfamily hydrolase